MNSIHHVGVAVEDLAAARSVWDSLLGQEPEIEEVPTQGVTAAMYPCGIELIAPSSPASPISRFLAKRGPGIHHVTIEVGDLDAELARLRARHTPLINEYAVRGVGGSRIAFLHPSAANGVLVELKEKSHGPA